MRNIHFAKEIFKLQHRATNLLIDFSIEGITQDLKNDANKIAFKAGELIDEHLENNFLSTQNVGLLETIVDRVTEFLIRTHPQVKIYLIFEDINYMLAEIMLNLYLGE